MCKFDMILGPVFKPGAGIAPTHGGFLMCGIDDDDSSSLYNVFSVGPNISTDTMLQLNLKSSLLNTPIKTLLIIS